MATAESVDLFVCLDLHASSDNVKALIMFCLPHHSVVKTYLLSFSCCPLSNLSKTHFLLVSAGPFSRGN
jgi:hypothetical protein